MYTCVSHSTDSHAFGFNQVENHVIKQKVLKSSGINFFINFTSVIALTIQWFMILQILSMTTVPAELEGTLGISTVSNRPL